MGPLRWGILSAGKISNDFCVGLSTLPQTEHQMVAVAARNLDSANEFAKNFGIAKAYGSYEELLKDSNVDVVYVGSINPQHLSLTKMALDNGKHVLCEKPLGINVKQTKEMLDYAKQKKLFLMEALWSRFFPLYKRVTEEINKGTVGDVLQVMVNFGVPIADVDRIKLKEMGGGTVLDIGIYCVQFALLAFGGEKPLKIISGGHLNSEGVDVNTSTTLIYSNGRTATLITHGKLKLQNDASVIGTKGTLKVHDPFWCSTKLETPTGVLDFPVPVSNKKMFFDNSTGLSFQCHEVRRCIQEGLLESSVWPHEQTLLLAEILESIRKQIGVVYPQDA